MKPATVVLVLLIFTSISVSAEIELPAPGITPDSIFYGLDKALERVRFALARDEVSKAKLQVEFANERIAEAKEMTEKGKPEYLPGLLKDYETNIARSNEIIETAKGIEIDTSQVDELVATATAVHVDVLEAVLEVADPQAKDAIQRSIARSEKGQEEALNRLGEVKPGRSAELYLMIAEKRLNKAARKVNTGDIEEAESLVEDYRKKAGKSMEMLERAKELNIDVTEVEETVLTATSTHQELLLGILETMPEESKEAIERAIDVATRGREEALKALNLTLPPQAERAKAGRQEDGDSRIIPETPRKTPSPINETPAEEPREEREEERIPEPPVTPKAPIETEPQPETPAPPSEAEPLKEPETPETREPPETEETPSQLETPAGGSGRP
jgi:hypothetical protein